MKMRKLWKVVNNLVSAVLIIALFSTAALVITSKLQGGDPQVFGYQVKTVLSGSMEPEIQPGSVIAVRTLTADEANNMQPGDVITFMEAEDKLITHRITEVTETSEGALYTTKGDNNNAPDREPVQAANVLASYEGFTIPYVGYIASFAQSPNGALAFLVLPGILMVGYSLITIMLSIRKLDTEKDSKSADAS